MSALALIKYMSPTCSPLKSRLLGVAVYSRWSCDVISNKKLLSLTTTHDRAKSQLTQYNNICVIMLTIYRPKRGASGASRPGCCGRREINALVMTVKTDQYLMDSYKCEGRTVSKHETYSRLWCEKTVSLGFKAWFIISTGT